MHVVHDVQTLAVIAYETHPLNVAETTTAADLMSDPYTPIPDGSLLLGDRLFDSNNLHKAAWQRGCQLIAPRKRPGTGLGNRRHHPNRRESMRFTEGTDQAIWHDVLARQREKIERFFGMLVASSGGLIGLPAWVRRLHRVRLWVAAKLAINAARIASKRALAA